MTIRLALVALVAFVLTPSPGSAQSLSYTKGQNVSPAYEGWEEGADGTKYFLFGYMNRNWEEELNVPVGADNSFSPGNSDQGQPTHFLPRRNRFVFRVPAPKSFTEKDELIWTLTTYGKTEKAYATLRLDYKVDDVVKASETGALGAGTSSPEVRANTPPVVKVEGPKTLTAKVGQPLTLTALVKDDGIPKRRVGGGSAAVSNVGSRRDAAAAAAGRGGDPAQQRQNRAMLPPARVTVGKNVGLHLSWFVYRGAGAVTFDPEQVKPWEDTRAGANSPWAPLWTPPEMPADGKVVVHATFTEPGTYVLRGLADDGALFGSDEITVTVRP
jgi:autonomous glycyl radical cofactor GrcA